MRFFQSGICVLHSRDEVMQVLREEWTEKAQSKLFDLEPLTDELIKGVMLELESFQKLLARHATTSSADVTWVEQQLQQMWLFRL